MHRQLAQVTIVASLLSAAALATARPFDSRALAQGKPFDSRALAQGKPFDSRALAQGKQLQPTLTFAFEVRATVGPPLDVGAVAQGRRRIVPITGGTFEGANFRGKVMPGGADWQIIRSDGLNDLDTRYTPATDTWQFVYSKNGGVRHVSLDVMKRLLACESVDPTLVYFLIFSKKGAASPDLQWL